MAAVAPNESWNPGSLSKSIGFQSKSRLPASRSTFVWSALRRTHNPTSRTDAIKAARTIDEAAPAKKTYAKSNKIVAALPHARPKRRVANPKNTNVTSETLNPEAASTCETPASEKASFNSGEIANDPPNSRPETNDACGSGNTRARRPKNKAFTSNKRRISEKDSADWTSICEGNAHSAPIPCEAR